MAEKRSFTKKITESDAFLDMPISTQCLYFHLNMDTDDDGFVNSPKRIVKMIGASEDDLKLLIAKNFVIVFESGVIVIKHFRMHNTLRNDRYHATNYQEEFKKLGLKDNGSYTINNDFLENGNQMETNGIPNGNQMETEHNITKHNITKHKNIYGKYHNVLLTDEEAEKLDKQLGYEFISILDWFSEYLEMKGTKYKSHFIAIRRWVINAYRKEQEKHIESLEHKDMPLPDYEKLEIVNRKVDTTDLDNFRKENQ